MREPELPVGDAPVVLAATHHDPEGRWMPVLARHLDELKARYARLAVLCSRTTAPEAVRQLREAGVLATEDGHPPSRGRLGQVRRQVLQLALEAGAEQLHFCDLDRALHWVAWHPQELEKVLQEMPEYDFLVLGRTPEAFASHPPDQTLTESLANTVFNLTTGLGWDIVAASRGISARAARWLLGHSREATFGTDAEWPMLLRQAGEFHLGYRECDGLGFETADAYPEEVQAAGGRDAWRLQRSRSADVWARRLEAATWIAQAAVDTQRRLLAGGEAR